MNIQTKDLVWGTDKFITGMIIYGGKDYGFKWENDNYIINGPPSSSSSDFDEAKLIEALNNEFNITH